MRNKKAKLLRRLAETVEGAIPLTSYIHDPKGKIKIKGKDIFLPRYNTHMLYPMCVRAVYQRLKKVV